MGLRVTRDGEYFQFVEAIASGIDLTARRVSSISAELFWAWFAREAVELLKIEIKAGALPLSDPTQALRVSPSVDAAVRQAELETTDALRSDTVVASFEQ